MNNEEMDRAWREDMEFDHTLRVAQGSLEDLWSATRENPRWSAKAEALLKLIREERDRIVRRWD